jgi:hypothetical protein
MESMAAELALINLLSSLILADGIIRANQKRLLSWLTLTTVYAIFKVVSSLSLL